MNRIQHDLVQGTAPWQQFRLEHHGASEAAAMLGLSLTMKRSELLRMKHSGLPREFSDWLQANVLDHGHAVEAAARPHIEAQIGDGLYPVTYSLGRLSASCDGLTLDRGIAMEHKQWSERLASLVLAGQMPEEHIPQCQQVTLVTGASRCLFVVSDGTPDRMVSMWVDADPAWHQRLIDGWAQFDRDLAAYTTPAPTEAAPVGKAPDTLPALHIEVTGMVTASNLAAFKDTALSAIRSVNRDLNTDADFADADKAVKWCADVEARLKAAKEHALSQTASIDELFKALDDIAAESKAVRLDLGKLVERRKVERKEAAVAAARKALDVHIAALNGELAPMALRPALVDFAAAIKGLRSFASMDDALGTAVANGKIAMDVQARVIRCNLAVFKTEAAGLESLFADLGQIVHKAADDFAALVANRIATHCAAEAAKEAQRQAAEAARIAAAEQRAREQEAARIAAQQRQEHEAAEASRRAAEKVQQAAIEASASPVVLTYGPVVLTYGPDVQQSAASILQAIAPRLAQDDCRPLSMALASKPDAPLHAREAAAAIAEPATLNLGAINARIAPLSISAQGLADLGIVHVATDKSAKLYRESQYPLICAALVRHIGRVLQPHGVAA